MPPYIGIVPEPPDCPYELIAEIGSGGCATVYSAIHPDRPFEPVAVKVQKDGPLARERFQGEIDVLRRLDHAHLMPLIEASTRDLWYAMPLADVTLRAMRKETPVAWESLRICLGGVCGALMHAHAHGIIHRDLSPDNILAMRGEQGLHWLLADFGLALRHYASKSITPVGAAFGAPEFAAPEVRHDPRSATPASDAYALGRLASWFTNITSHQNGLSVQGRHWSELIRGAMAFEPVGRWSVSHIAYHLEHPPLERVVFGIAPCARCGAHTGYDGAGRCVRCGFMDEI